MLNLRGTEILLTAIAKIEQNDRICYVREFSIEHFHDFKVFEAMSGKIARVMHMFAEEYREEELNEILAEYGIYHTPNYVYFKGCVSLAIGNNTYQIGELRQGIGISGEDIEKICFEDVTQIHRIVTIENLTTFFRWEEFGSLMIYLGGYHNSVRRALLKKYTVYCRTYRIIISEILMPEAFLFMRTCVRKQEFLLNFIR